MIDEPLDVLTLIQAIDARTARFDTALTGPDGVIRQGLHDTLRIYGLVSQMAELMKNLIEQQQALTDVTSMLLGRMIEHDRRAIHTAAVASVVLELVQAMAPPEIAAAAADARAVILVEQQAQLVELAAHERIERDRLREARQIARGELAAEAAGDVTAER